MLASAGEEPSVEAASRPNGPAMELAVPTRLTHRENDGVARGERMHLKTMAERGKVVRRARV